MKKQRILSALLTLCLVFSMLPTALAAGADDFTDVGRDSWCYEYVDYVTSEGYFLGTSDTTFSPNRNMTRAMFVVVLARFDDVRVDNSQSAFTDVEPGAWCAGAINWAAANKIVEGKGNGKFAPNDPITRAQMCAIMDRYLDYYTEKHDVTVEQKGRASTLADQSQVPSYATEAVRNCQKYGLINGYEDGTFRPQAYSTRAHVAAIIYRLSFLVDGAEPVKKPSNGHFNGNGGTEQEPEVIKYLVTYIDANGNKVPVWVESGKNFQPSRLNDENRTFLGWRDQNRTFYDADKIENTGIPINGTTTLYPVWDKYKVTYDDGTVMYTDLSGQFTTPAAPARDDYSFGGWKGSDGKIYDGSTTYTTDVDLTLTAVWTLIPTYTYKLTYDANGGSFTGENPETVSGTTETLSTTVTSVKPTWSGHAFKYWVDAEGTVYQSGASISISGDTTLYAVWEEIIVDPADLIGGAMQKTIDVDLKEYVDKINAEGGSVNGASASVEFAYNAGPADDPKAPRPQTLTIHADVSDDIPVKMITYAATVACKLVDATGDARDEIITENKDKVDTMVQEIIDSVKNVTGIDIKDQSVQQIKDQVYELLKTEGKSLWANFYNEKGYFTDDITVTAGNYTVTVDVDQANNSTTLAGGVSKRTAVKEMATAIAKELYADLKKYGTYTSAVEMDSVVTLTFSKPANEDHAQKTEGFTYVYPVTVKLDLVSDGLVQYKFAGDTSYLAIGITPEIEKAYNDAVEDMAQAAVYSDKLRNKLTGIIDDVLSKDNTYSNLKDKLEAEFDISLTLSETEAKAALLAETGAWLDANLDAFYTYLWVESGSIADMDVNELCDNSVLVEAIWNAAAKDIPQNAEDMAVWVDALIAKQMVGFDIVEEVKSNQAAALLASLTGIVINDVDDINDLLDVTITIDSTTLKGRDVVYEQAKAELDSRFAGTHYEDFYKQLDKTAKDYLIYSALVSQKLNFQNEQSATRSAGALDILAETIESIAKEYIAQKIDVRVTNAIKDALSEGGSLENYVDYLTKAQSIKTYDGLEQVKFSNLAALLKSDLLAETLKDTGDSYVKDYLSKIIGKLPESASITVNQVTIDKAELKSVFDGVDSTVGACQALAAIIEKFGDLSIADFGVDSNGTADGIAVTLVYNARTFDFNLVIDKTADLA